MKVLASTSTFCRHDGSPLRMIADAGIEVETNPYGRKLTEDEIRGLLHGKAGLIAGTEPLTAAVLESATDLKVISRCGIGMDNVDMEAAERLGIKVYNTPDAVTPAVAELAIGLMLSCLRRIPQSHVIIHEGGWKKEMGYLLRGKTVGIIGFGRVGKEVGRLAMAFGADVLYNDISEVQCQIDAECASFEDVLGNSDILTLHASCAKEHCPLIGRAEIDMMKDGSVLLNTSRGDLVEEAALYEALKSGKLFAAGLDVFPDEPYGGCLKGLHNAVLTCHIGSYAMEARVSMEYEATLNLLKGLGLEGTS
jgi:D-3-phosphoglycerate dehydrogenase